MESVDQQRATSPYFDMDETQPPAMSKLPVEMIKEIGNHCFHDAQHPDANDYKTLANLCLVSRNFARCCTPLLYRAIILHKVNGVDKLMQTLASSSELCNHIQNINVKAEHMTFESDIRTTFAAVHHWMETFYSQYFAMFLLGKISKRPQAPDSLIALLIAMAPNLQVLSFARHRGYLPVAAILQFKARLGRSQQPSREATVLHNLRSLYFHNAQHKQSMSHRPAVMQPFFLDTQLQTLLVKNVKCFDTDYLVMKKHVGVPSACHVMNRLESCTFRMSTIGTEFLNILMSQSPLLKTLIMIDNFFCVDKSDGECLSLGTLGRILRQHGGSLERLEIRHHSNHPLREKSYDCGHIGSIAGLHNLEGLCINPDLLLGSDYEHFDLGAALPTSLKRIHFLPRKAEPLSPHFVGQITHITSRGRFQELSGIDLKGFRFDLEFAFRDFRSRGWRKRRMKGSHNYLKLMNMRIRRSKKSSLA